MPTRREVIQAAGAALAAGMAPAATVPGHAFFTAEEFAMLDELTETILPADEHSPGARAAQVAAYIDRTVGEAFDQSARDAWREGLGRVNALSGEMHGVPFLKASAKQRTAVLTRMAAHERRPKLPEELFFRRLKAATVRGYYTSKTGIHTELEYKGNVYLEQFAGTDVSKA